MVVRFGRKCTSVDRFVGRIHTLLVVKLRTGQKYIYVDLYLGMHELYYYQASDMWTYIDTEMANTYKS